MIEGITATLPSSVSQESSRPLARPRNPAGSVDSSVQVGAQQPARADSSAAASSPLSPETVQQLAAELDAAVSGLDGDYSISVDKDSGMIIVRITDAVTGEIVKQIPPKELLEADRSMERIVGLLVDDQV